MQEALRAKAFYVGDEVTETKRQVRPAPATLLAARCPPWAGSALASWLFLGWHVNSGALPMLKRQTACLASCERRCLQVARMAVDTKAPGQAPPDLPSLLLDGRICYIGMPVRADCSTR